VPVKKLASKIVHMFNIEMTHYPAAVCRPSDNYGNLLLGYRFNKG